MQVWKMAKPGCNFCGFHIPTGAVYGILPEIVERGRHHTKLCIYVTDLDLCRKNRHFVVYTMRVGYPPRREYVDGSRGWAKSIQAAVREMYESGQSMEVKPVILSRDIAKIAPRDRVVGEYMQKAKLRHGRTQDEAPYIDGEAPDIMIDNYVTNGCKVGKTFLVEEGYCSKMYNMSAPDYSHKKQA